MELGFSIRVRGGATLIAVNRNETNPPGETGTIPQSRHPTLASARQCRYKANRGAPMTASDDRPFWQRKTLAEMTTEEWESLCDGCGRCCLNKLEDEDTGEIYYTDVGCRLLDGRACRCRDYDNRSTVVEDCVRLTPQNIGEISWLPPTCAYRLLAQGHDLYWWHPLVSNDPGTVHSAGISVRGRVGLREDRLPKGDELEYHIVEWPGVLPDDKSAADLVPRRRVARRRP
jgi:uncharacterized protein